VNAIPSSLHYRAYGLRLRSSSSVPGLTPYIPDVSDGSPDLILHWGSPPSEAPVRPEQWIRAYASEREAATGDPLFVLERTSDPSPWLRLGYADGTWFWISPDRREMWASWSMDSSPEDASTYLLGPILGYLLRLRGTVALHASAVRTPGGAVAFVGARGTGKSTTAAALVQRRHPLVTEDVCALREGDGEVEVLPGYPLIRLWDASVEMLWGRADALPLLTPSWEKRYMPVDDGEGAAFATEPVPLRALFLLQGREDTDAPRVDPLSPAEALIFLVGNTYKNLLLDPDQRAEEFHALRRLLERVPIHLLVPHTSGARIGELCDLILQVSGEGAHV
jgi:hypothetical protein